MNEQSKEFGLFIDGLRIDRNLSREDLCDEIISISQYKRYLNGSASIPNNKLIMLADRLSFSISEIHSLFQKKYNSQYIKIIDIYNLIKRERYNEAYKKAIELSKTPIISSYNNMFFDYCMYKIQHELEMLSSVNVLEAYSKLINYPGCQNNETFNWIEINILTEIVLVSSSIENYEPSEVLFKILTSNQIQKSTADNRFALPTIYSILSQLLGKQKKFEEVVLLTKKGIDFSNYHEISNAVSNLLIINSFAHFDLGNFEQALKSAQKAFMQIYIEDKPEKFQQFKKSFENKFKMSIEELKKTDW